MQMQAAMDENELISHPAKNVPIPKNSQIARAVRYFESAV